MSTPLLATYGEVSRILDRHGYVTRVVVIRDGQVVDALNQGVKNGERPEVWFLHTVCGIISPNIFGHQSVCDKALPLESMEEEALKAYMS